MLAGQETWPPLFRVATKYPRTTASWFEVMGQSVEIVRLHGSVELAPQVGLVDGIVDLTATGRTLRENKLRVAAILGSSTARLIANQASLKTRTDAVQSVVGRLRAAADQPTGRAARCIAGLEMNRFDAQTWAASPQSRRGLDLSRFDAERRSVIRDLRARRCRRGRSASRIQREVRRLDARSLARRFEVGPGEMSAAAGRLAGRRSRRARVRGAPHPRAFTTRQVVRMTSGSGGLELLTRPVRRAGLYAPGGRAAYPSTVLMTAIPARVAGVREVVLATPPRADGTVPDAILAAAHIAGVDTVYRVGGAQAIAAMAYGTASIPRVDLIAGPGNLYVNLAKREVFGAVGIDGIAGPTEVMVDRRRERPSGFRRRRPGCAARARPARTGRAGHRLGSAGRIAWTRSWKTCCWAWSARTSFARRPAARSSSATSMRR